MASVRVAQPNAGRRDEGDVMVPPWTLIGVLLFFLTSSIRAGAPFDYNGDGVVDLQDYARFATCLADHGPGEPSGLLCFSSRGDFDTDVDLVDAAVFLNGFTGSIPGPVCGNGLLELGEQCDDGNTNAGDGCGSTCQFEGPTPRNDACADAIPIGDGSLTYSNVAATTDGPDEQACTFFGRSQVESDIWYLYTATCTGSAVFSLCGSDYDTKLAVYGRTLCPARDLLACSDDDCGNGVENVQSRVEVVVRSGETYLVRVGSFEFVQGAGRLTISCGVDACREAPNDCFEPAPAETPGCTDAKCCFNTCQLDWYCCDVTWDANCAAEAHGVCEGNFLTCTPDAGSCGLPDGTPGCDDPLCCNSVCLFDPFCCLTEWDATCVNEAESTCLLTCGAGAGACDSTHLTPGCSVESCCATVCGIDEFCCSTEWDQVCVDLAAQNCP
jgi:cysteine-rich repeat protein